MRRRALALFTCIAFVGACSDGAPSSVQPAAIDEPLPALEGPTLDGGRFSSAELDGSPLVVNAWASWCDPCETETPQLIALSREYADEGVRFVGVNHGDQHAAASAFAERFGVPYPSLEDPAGRYAASFGYVGLPATFVVDASGTVRWALFGPTTSAQLAPLIDDVLGARDSGSGSTYP